MRSTRHTHRFAGDPAAPWKASGGGHIGGLSSRPREYERRIVGFFDDAFLPPAEGGRRADPRR